ncbi:MAG: Smr/MutS family protein, partial [Croceibacterium sp.]
MKPPRGLTADEAALWRRVTATVVPLDGKVPPRNGEGDRAKRGGGGSLPGAALGANPHHQPPAGPPPPTREDRGKPATRSPDRAGLDAAWERKLARPAIEPDFTLDLHGHTLDQAHRRLDSGLAQAKSMGARLVLLITGKPRPVDPADRGTQRGAIRAKVLDWLAAGPHGGDVAAVRPAHRRHGGD